MVLPEVTYGFWGDGNSQRTGERSAASPCAHSHLGGVSDDRGEGSRRVVRETAPVEKCISNQ